MASIFTRIIRGDIPGRFVFRDDLWVAILDIAPANPGHVLLIPCEEQQYLSGLSPATLSALGERMARLIATVKQATGAPAVNVLVNDGPEANQAVPHAHIHIIPRFAQDKKLIHPHGTPYGEGEIELMAVNLEKAWREHDGK
jgi:histidine triad (HIT) family protein